MAKTVLLWNSTGMPADRRDLLSKYVEDHAVDYVFLVEGGRGVSFSDKGGLLVNTVSVHEKMVLRNQLKFGDGEDQIRRVFGATARSLEPLGGGGAYKYYCYHGQGISLEDEDQHVDYEKVGSKVREWILAPAADRIKAAAASAAATTAVNAASVPDNPRKRGRGSDDDDGGVKRSKIDLQPYKETMQKRANFLGALRPKPLRLGPLVIYLWHTSPGGAADPRDPEMAAIAGASSGGSDAKYHNHLFKKHIGKLDADAVLMGDLNIDVAAVQHIYGCSPAASSKDGWCHVVPGSSGKVTAIATPDHDKAKMGDHAPIIFSLDIP